ncbi:MAG: fatty acid desaturase [Gammaproteobacteria bacterium]|nr:fatty acid desaturase [Gammaproteobacteria bacterium]
MYGLLDLSLGGYVLATFILTQITIAGVTLYLHRSQAHRGVDFHPVLAHFFRFWLWLTTSMSTRGWAAVHRKHHAHCETAGDPHSPQVLGLKKVLTEGAELYRAEATNPETLEKFGKGCPDDWIERNLYMRWPIGGVSLMLFIDWLLFGLPGTTVWAVQMMWIPIWAAGVINGLGHYVGYRNYECPDASRNLVPWGLFIGGEELHNNHHTFGTSAKFSQKWWELDIGWGYIRVLEWLRLATVKRVAPQPAFERGRVHIDVETVKSVLTNRFQLMASYSRTVVLPVLLEERRKAGEAGAALFRRAKVLLVRESSLIKPADKEHLQALLSAHQSLQVVREFQTRLEATWKRTAASQQELIASLQQWCAEAEATGIRVLAEFAAQLKTYRLAPAMA